MSADIDLVLKIVNHQILDIERRGQDTVPVGPNTLKAIIGEIYRLRARLAPADAIEDGLPVHCPIVVTEDGQGPADNTPEAFMTVCWCADSQCTKFYARGAV